MAHSTKTPRWRRAWMALLLPVALMAAACSDNPTGNTEPVSQQSQTIAMEKTSEALIAGHATQTANLVEDLTGGFAIGLGDEDAGLSTELGGEIPVDGPNAKVMILGSRLSYSQSATAQAKNTLSVQIAQGKAATDPQPGDLLAEFTEENLDGSITTISVYQGEPLAVVRVVLATTWPNGNLLLSRITEEVQVDRGANFEIEDDDTWLSYRGEIEFTTGAQLVREIDESNDGGVQDDDRITLVSTFVPRPNHPRLVSITTDLVVDVHSLADENDDRFVRADRVTRFAGSAHGGGNPRVEESLVPEQPVAEGEEPCGGTISRSVTFRNDRPLASASESAQWTCAGGGTLRRDVSYADGSSAYLQLSDAGDGIIQLDAQERDGTATAGSFDEAAGTFQVSTTYPNGSDPVSRSISGRALSETSWELDESVVFADGFTERNHLEGSETAQGNRLAGTHDGRDESVSFELTTNADETVLEGHVENDRDETLDFRLEALADGGALLDFTAVDSERTVEGHLELDPDGCGKGTLIVTEGEKRTEMDIEFCENGEPEVVATR